MDFFIGVLVGGLMVGGVILAKVLAMKAEAKAAPSTYLTGKGRDTGGQTFMDSDSYRG